MPPSELLVPMTVGGVPASPNGQIPARPGKQVTLRADRTAEYVSSSAYVWWSQYLRALPFPIDDIESEFGDDLYGRMSRDAQVAADVQRLKAAILEDGVRLTNVVKTKDEDGYALGSEVALTLQANLDELEVPIDDSLWDMLDAMIMGNRVAELVYRTEKVKDKQLLALNRLSVKARRTTAFVVDAYARVVGLLGQLPSGFSPVMVGSILADIAEQPNLIARPKFAVLTWRPHDMDPRGTSLATPAFKSWWSKQQVLGDLLKYLAQFASPSLIGFTPPEAQRTALTDALGNVLLNDSGQPVVSDPEQNMLNNLVQWQNGTVAAFRGGSAIQLVQSTGEGRAFLSALQFYNREIGKALTTQSLATEEGQHDARAAATVHQDALDTLIRQAKRSVERMIRRDILKKLVLYNWNEETARLFTPIVSLGRTEEHDFRQEGETVARLYAVGYISESQKGDIDRRLGLPERDVAYDLRHAQIVTQVRPERTVPTTGGPQETQNAAMTQLGDTPQAAQGSTAARNAPTPIRRSQNEGQGDKVAGASR